MGTYRQWGWALIVIHCWWPHLLFISGGANSVCGCLLSTGACGGHCLGGHCYLWVLAFVGGQSSLFVVSGHCLWGVFIICLWVVVVHGWGMGPGSPCPWAVFIILCGLLLFMGGGWVWVVLVCGGFSLLWGGVSSSMPWAVIFHGWLLSICGRSLFMDGGWSLLVVDGGGGAVVVLSWGPAVMGIHCLESHC